MAGVIQLLLDTAICIELLRGRQTRLDERVRQHVPGDLAVSASTVFELTYGAARSNRPEQHRAALAAFFLPLVIVPFDSTAAAIAGELRAALERAGTPIDPNDLLIAAQALTLGVPLVTNNEREFGRVPGLALANWTR